jgi:hypothetical protein
VLENCNNAHPSVCRPVQPSLLSFSAKRDTKTSTRTLAPLISPLHHVGRPSCPHAASSLLASTAARSLGQPGRFSLHTDRSPHHCLQMWACHLHSP